jgi:hypothetical protein
MKITQHATSQAAWEYINEFLANSGELLMKENTGYATQGVIISYDNLLQINTLWVKPTFDFGKMFNYRPQKWNSLVSNYLDLDTLDLVKNQILLREPKKEYNFAYQFSNSHGHGKGCLVSILFQRRKDRDNPLITAVVRSSEVTKRLLFDMLLLQRVSEYIYGEIDQSPSLEIFCRSMYLHADSFLMYNNHRRFDTFLTKNKYSDHIRAIFDKYQGVDPETISYKMVRRAVRQIQLDDKGEQVYKTKPLLAKNLHIYANKKYPEDCISPTARKLFDKQTKK